MPPPDGVLEFLGLESCAECIAGCGCVVRTYGDLICCAVCVAIVIVAVLHVTLDPFNVLTAAIFAFLHFHFSFPLAVGFMQKTVRFRCIYSFPTLAILYDLKGGPMWHFSS